MWTMWRCISYIENGDFPLPAMLVYYGGNLLFYFWVVEVPNLHFPLPTYKWKWYQPQERALLLVYLEEPLYMFFFAHQILFIFFGGENTFSNTYIWCISCQGISNNRQGRNTAEGFFRVFDRSVCVVVFCGYRVRHVEFTVTPGRCWVYNLVVKIELKNNTFCVDQFGDLVANFHMEEFNKRPGC